jgi:hypothetical protein
MDKILVLENDSVHPTVKTVVSVIKDDGRLVTVDGLKFGANRVLKVGDVIDEGEFRIAYIGADSVEVSASDGTRYIVPFGKIEWCDSCGDFHVYLDEDSDEDDEIDEYTSGYTDAIRDCVEYLLDSSTSKVRKTLKKMNTNYLSDIDTDEKIAEFVSKRLEKKPQLTLDDLKEIVGYDFDLV